MPIRLTAVPDEGQVKLVPPVGRHLESRSWWVAAQVLKSRLIVRVWMQYNDDFRVIVLDRDGSEDGSVMKLDYNQALTALGLPLNGTQHVSVEGRRLVSGGDRDWEIAAEIHTVGDEQYLYVRVWLHRKQRFVLYVIDRAGKIADRATGDYTQAKQRVVSHLTA